MTTEQIRKKITVFDFSLTTTGIHITYADKIAYLPNYSKSLNLAPTQALTSLEQIGSIKKFDAAPIRVYWDSPKGAICDGPWELFCNHFTLSQYEAITLVVRHEYEKSLKSDMNLLEIDKALEALKH